MVTEGVKKFGQPSVFASLAKKWGQYSTFACFLANMLYCPKVFLAEDQNLWDSKAIY